MSTFICQKCKEAHGSELEDEEEYLEEEDEESIDDEELIDDDESIGDESDASNQLIISEPAVAPQQPAQQQQQSAEKPTVKTEKNSLVIENSNSNDLVQKVSPSAKRKAATVNSDLLADKALIKQTMNGGVKAVRKKQTKSAAKQTKKQQAVEEEDENQLYCICRTPYNESQFYVQCESASCLEWYHGEFDD